MIHAVYRAGTKADNKVAQHPAADPVGFQWVWVHTDAFQLFRAQDAPVFNDLIAPISAIVLRVGAVFLSIQLCFKIKCLCVTCRVFHKVMPDQVSVEIGSAGQVYHLRFGHDVTLVAVLHILNTTGSRVWVP